MPTVSSAPAMAANRGYRDNAVRRARLVMVAPDPRHPRRSQAEILLIDLSEFGQPPLVVVGMSWLSLA
jgi:hypothetical protein